MHQHLCLAAFRWLQGFNGLKEMFKQYKAAVDNRSCKNHSYSFIDKRRLIYRLSCFNHFFKKFEWTSYPSVQSIFQVCVMQQTCTRLVSHHNLCVHEIVVWLGILYSASRSVIILKTSPWNDANVPHALAYKSCHLIGDSLFTSLWRGCWGWVWRKAGSETRLYGWRCSTGFQCLCCLIWVAASRWVLWFVICVE